MPTDSAGNRTYYAISAACAQAQTTLEVPHFLRMVVLVHADTISNSDFYGSRYRYAEYDGALQA